MSRLKALDNTDTRNHVAGTRQPARNGPSSAPAILGLRFTASHDASVLVRSVRSGYRRAAVTMTNSPGTR